jgi:RNA polymerase sigma-70 factor (ECF subfamily)
LDTLEQFAARVSRGDTDAFREIVEATSVRLVRVAARILGDSGEAEDVVQEAYVKAYRSLVEGRFDQRSSVPTWLHRIVANGAIDALRSRGRRALPLEQLPEGRWDGVGTSEAHLALRELDDWLSDLPAEQRVALVLKSVEGLETTEIAAILGVSEGAVEQKLVRARAALRRKGQVDD